MVPVPLFFWDWKHGQRRYSALVPAHGVLSRRLVNRRGKWPLQRLRLRAYLSLPGDPRRSVYPGTTVRKTGYFVVTG